MEKVIKISVLSAASRV